MKVTQVAVRPTEASNTAGRPSLTPELLAASGARYSRNNEGLDAILSKIDPDNLDKSVDSIFKMIDYGHQSIADMVPVSMFIDGISIWLAYYVWSICPTAGGQESSTRYIKLSVNELIDPEILGITNNEVDEWLLLMEESFTAYQTALTIWEEIALKYPNAARIPKYLIEDNSDKARKQVARMKRNFGFDRARYFLPVAASTNMMLLMSARGWVQLCQQLLSHPLPEPQTLGKAIREELELCAPRMLRHATEKDSFKKGLKKEFDDLRFLATNINTESLASNAETYDAKPTASLELMLQKGISASSFKEDLEHHNNRYAWIGPSLRNTAIRFGWEAVAFAEIRDLNRHRTGSKSCPLIPVGFYSAKEQIPQNLDPSEDYLSRLHEISNVGRLVSKKALDYLLHDQPNYLYWTVLGTQYPFEHLTTADKFLYEAELRTGTGAHFRYAKHLRDVLSLWYEIFPETKAFVLEGSAEPE